MVLNKLFSPRLKKIWTDNLHFIIIIPTLVVTHWAWFELQDNELFVPRDQKKGHPFFRDKDVLFGRIRHYFYPEPAEEPSIAEVPSTSEKP